MLNEAHIEGIIISKWSYSAVQFMRIAVYPDAGRRTQRTNAQGREVPDYVTLRCEGLLALMAGNLREGDRVRAAGQLSSREYDIPLETLARKARGAEKAMAKLRALAAQHGDDVTLSHVTNEILIDRLAALQRAERAERPARPARDRRERAASSPPVAAGATLQPPAAPDSPAAALSPAEALEPAEPAAVAD